LAKSCCYVDKPTDTFTASLGLISTAPHNTVIASGGFVSKTCGAPRSNPGWFFLLYSIWIASCLSPSLTDKPATRNDGKWGESSQRSKPIQSHNLSSTQQCHHGRRVLLKDVDAFALLIN
jgi:hypothetical protein